MQVKMPERERCLPKHLVTTRIHAWMHSRLDNLSGSDSWEQAPRTKGWTAPSKAILGIKWRETRRLYI